MGLFEVSGIWVIATGKTIVHSIWIGLLIFAVLKLMLSYIPLRLSSLRYGISVFSLLLLLISIITTFLLLHEPLSSIQQMKILPGTSQGEAVYGISFVFRLFGYIYFAGVLFMILRSWTSLAYIRGLRKSGIQLAPSWQTRFSQISKALGITRSVDFLESTRVNAPLLLGYLKPVVILPAGMVTHLPVSQIETILLHELYHLKRNDYLVNIVQLFIEGLLFYHPVVWIISGIIRSEREHCCDDSVLNTCDNPINYAKALINIAEQQHYTRLAPGAVGSRKNQFEFRIKRILKYDTMRTNMRDKILSLALLAGSIVLLLTVSGFSAGPSFIRIHKINSELTPELADPIEIMHPDTLPQKREQADLEEVAEPDELEDFEWEPIEIEIEGVFNEALEEIKEIDWEEMKEEMEATRLEALEEIEEIDWEEIRVDMELSISDMKIDMEDMKIEFQNSINGIDWDAISEDIRIDLEYSKVFLDSIKIEMDL